ncbi:MAG: phosphoglycolate phosphatase [Burkholderiales bacterium]|nr:phosphoglycolate phosphatase [Burkholderiales bacterium]
MLNKKFPLEVKAVLIDLDGTLLDTIHDLAEAANHTRLALGMTELPTERIKTFIGKGMANLVKCSLTDSPTTDPDPLLLEQAMAEFERQYMAVLTRDILHFPGVKEGIKRLHDAGFRLACVTNKAERFTLPLLEASGLMTYFDLVICGDTTTEKKPHPMPLLYAAQRLGVAPDEMVLIGDSVNDFEAARAAGCHVFIVPYGYNEGRDAALLPADAIVPGLVEAANLLKNTAPAAPARRQQNIE